MGKVVKNSLINILRVFIVTPIFFILIPYTISKVGTEGYGLWALTGIIASYQSFVNLGLTHALVRFIAKAKAQDDVDSISEYLGTSFWLYLAICLILGMGVYFFRQEIVIHVLNVSSNIDIAESLLVMAFLASAINMLSGLFKSTLDGLQRMDASNLVLVVQVIISGIGTYVFLELGYGLLGLGYNLLITSFLSFLANVVLTKRISKFRFSNFICKYSRIKEMFSYSVNLQLGSLIRAGIEPINKILISHLFTMEYVAFYDIAYKFSTKLGGLINAALTPILPAATEIFEKYDLNRFEDFRKKTTKFVFNYLLMVYVIIGVILYHFIVLWLDSANPEIITTTRIFLLGTFFSGLTIPCYFMLNSAGYSNDTFKIQLTGAISNVLVILGSVYFIGFWSFSVGFAFSMIQSFFVTHYYYYSRFVGNRSIYRSYSSVKTYAVNVFMILVGLLLIYLFTPENYIGIMIIGGLMFIGYQVMIFKFKILTVSDLENVGLRPVLQKMQRVFRLSTMR